MQPAGEFSINLPHQVQKERVRMISPVRRYSSRVDRAEFQDDGVEQRFHHTFSYSKIEPLSVVAPFCYFLLRAAIVCCKSGKVKRMFIGKPLPRAPTS